MYTIHCNTHTFTLYAIVYCTYYKLYKCCYICTHRVVYNTPAICLNFWEEVSKQMKRSSDECRQQYEGNNKPMNKQSGMYMCPRTYMYMCLFSS